MGTDVDGGMIVGRYGRDIQYDESEYESLYELKKECDLEAFANYYDADYDDCIVGISIDASWKFEDMDKLKEEFKKAKEVLEPLFGTEVFLYGAQDIW